MHFANERKCSPTQGAMLKAMGVMPGVSDLFLAYPMGRYSGFWMELKAPGKKPTQVQREFLQRMRDVGYCADWYDNWETARDAILEYLAG
jgi:hypothetical protein